MMTFFVFAAAAIAIAAAAAAGEPVSFKMVAGPPDEFRPPPDPLAARVNASSFFSRVTVAKNGLANFSFWVDDDGEDSPAADRVTLSIFLGEGRAPVSNISLSSSGGGTIFKPSWIVNDERLGIGNFQSPAATSFVFSLPPGFYECVFQCPSCREGVQVAALVAFPGALRVTGAIASSSQIEGLSLPFRATVDVGNRNRAEISEATLLVLPPTTTPHQKQKPIVQRMERTRPGEFAASMTPGVGGDFLAEIAVFGNTSSGMPFQRTTFHSFRVAPKSEIALTGTAKIATSGEKTCGGSRRAVIELGVTGGGGSPGAFRVYAEVFGSSPGMEESSVPVSWLGRIFDADGSGADAAVALELDERWLANANATLPLTLRNVRLEEAANFIPVSLRAEIQVASPPSFSFGGGPTSRVTDEMLQGCPPLSVISARAAAANSSEISSGGKLIVVHGYCTDSTPFILNRFNDFAVFEDFKQSRNNDDFARRIETFAASKSPGGYSVVGHSQGGLASLHLLTYYWSGLDKHPSATTGRLIQSVGSPYQGVPLAGLIAAVGGLVGVGCGSNEDLTYDGAQRWLAEIPIDKRQQVFYWSTSYSKKGFITSHYCNLAANAVLSWPNDGVVEQSGAVLPGGNLVEHAEGECHSTGMKYPPQCKNEARCEEIDRLAAR